jgi:hypothetical protein
VPVTPGGGLFEQLEERLEAAEQRARQEDGAAELGTEASALRARLVRTAARKNSVLPRMAEATGRHQASASTV